MGKSLFHKDDPERSAPTPHDLIEAEVAHLRKAKSIRQSPREQVKKAIWLPVLALCGLVWLYIMDPVLHAWYKGEAVRTYLYLHSYGAGPQANALVATQIFSPDEIEVLNNRRGSFQDYYSSPDAANKKAATIIDYMTGVQLLHAGKYDRLDQVGKVRCVLFIRPGIPLPTQWGVLDPNVGE